MPPIHLDYTYLYIHKRGNPQILTLGRLNPVGSYLLSSVTDDLQVFLLSFVCKLLVDSETSPFYQSLLSSNLGADYSPNTGFDNNAKDTSFAVGLQGVASEDVDKVLEVIDETWKRVVDEGFDDADIDAILHKVELQVGSLKACILHGLLRI